MYGMTDTITRNTVFDLQLYANQKNGYNKDLIHPCSHIINVVQEDGSQFSMDVCQLAIFFRYASQYDTMGKALDAAAAGRPEHARKED